MNNNIDLIIKNLHLSLNKNTLDHCQWSLQTSTNIIQAFTSDIYSYQEVNKNKLNYEIKIEYTNQQLKELKEIRLKSMLCLSEFMVSANGRNYYLTTYLQESDKIQIDANSNNARKWIMHQIGVKDILDMLRFRLKIGSEKDLDKLYLNIAWHITQDKHLHKHSNIYYLNIRDGIAELFQEVVKKNKTDDDVKECLENRQDVQIAVEINEEDYRQLMADEVSGLKLLALGRLKILKGSITTLGKFTNWFEKQ